MSENNPLVAFFTYAYSEVDNVANTAHRFDEYARRRGLPLLIIWLMNNPQRRREMGSAGPILHALDVVGRSLRFGIRGLSKPAGTCDSAADSSQAVSARPTALRLSEGRYLVDSFD